MTTYRSEGLGSLLRPQYLTTARGQFERGEIAAAEFKRIEDRAVDEAIAVQEAAGIDVVTDGEQRRYAFFGHLVDPFGGFEKFGGRAIPFRDESSTDVMLKSVDELRERVAEAARVVPIERLPVSPQCGFASTAEGNRLSPGDQRLKLEVVAETARAVWPAS
jgi:methionine synthase II (cobalamin-independent)